MGRALGTAQGSVEGPVVALEVGAHPEGEVYLIGVARCDVGADAANGPVVGLTGDRRRPGGEGVLTTGGESSGGHLASIPEEPEPQEGTSVRGMCHQHRIEPRGCLIGEVSCSVQAGGNRAFDVQECSFQVLWSVGHDLAAMIAEGEGRGIPVVRIGLEKDLR